MKIWPIFKRFTIRKAFEKRQDEFYYRIAADPITTDLRIRKLKNGSTVFARYTDKFDSPYAHDVYIFRKNMTIESKSYHYIKESNAQNKQTVGEIITRNFFKNNSYAPYKTTTKTIWKSV